VKLYRVMKADADGKPLVGDGSMMLGVRPFDPSTPHRRFDVPATAGSDAVNPGEGGLSCYTDPASITVRGAKLILWSIETDDVPVLLEAKPAWSPHYHVEPARSMTLDDLQQLLADTRDLWVRE
jgi:hypothetical protein